MKIRFLLLASVLAIAACGTEKPASTGKTTPIPEMSMYSLGTPITRGNMSLVPVLASHKQVQTEKQADDYVTLAEAQKNGWIKIQELPDGQEVSSLEVTNTGPKPILLLAGDLLLGGKQDRVVAKDTVVNPGETTKVPVFCVEHGRWSGETTKFDFSQSAVPHRVKTAVIGGEQEKVWDEVADYNTAAGGRPQGDTTINFGLSQSDTKKAIDDGLEFFASQLKNYKEAVGFVFVLNGKVQAMELFGSNGLLMASHESLLRGFLAESAVSESNAKTDVDLSACAAFVKESLSAGKRQTSFSAAGSGYVLDSPRIAGAEYNSGRNSREAEPDSIIHGSYNAK